MNPLRVIRIMLHSLMLIVNALLLCFACAAIVDCVRSGHRAPPVFILALAVAACAFVFVAFVRLGIHWKWEALSWVWFEMAWSCIFGIMQLTVTLNMTVDRDILCQIFDTMRSETRDPVAGWPCTDFRTMFALHWVAALSMLLPCLVFGLLAMLRCRDDPTIWEQDITRLHASPARFSTFTVDSKESGSATSEPKSSSTELNGETFYDVELGGSQPTPDHDSNATTRATSIWSQLSGPFFRYTTSRRPPIDRTLISKPLPYDFPAPPLHTETLPISNTIAAALPRVRYDRPLSLFGGYEPDVPIAGPPASARPGDLKALAAPQWARTATASRQRGRVPAFPTKRAVFPNAAAVPWYTSEEHARMRPPSSVADYPPRPDAPEPVTPGSDVNFQWSPTTVSSRPITPFYSQFSWPTRISHSQTVTEATTPRDVSRHSKSSGLGERVERLWLRFDASRSPMSDVSRYSKPSLPPAAHTRY
ncbi:hypothetical protein AURDEDRAFT_148946 [Auricularia subglabra TFB-10046 SS5]|nr:hypothetical protein AURDEDRAFT_148946 [Auricularia subglabra TFB-10046 SS5]